ncbi:MAG: sugar transferase [Desulfobaccales bacterium]
MASFFGIPLIKWKIALFFGDFLSFVASLLLCAWADQVFLGFCPSGCAVMDLRSLANGIIIFSTLYIADAYDYQQDYCEITNFLKIGLAVIVGSMVAFLASHLLRMTPFSHKLFLVQAATFLVLILAWRYLFSALLFTPKFFKRTLIVGAGGAGRRLLEIIREHPRCGLWPVGYIDDDPAKVGAEVGGLPVLGTSADLNSIIDKEQVSLVVVAITHDKQPPLVNRLVQACWQKVTLLDMPSIFEAITGKVPNSHISSYWFYQWNLNFNKHYYVRFKSILEPFVAAFCLLALLPLFLFIALAIKINSKGKVFYLQERLGKNKRPFKIIKFRTMVENAEENGPQFSTADDPRITRVGRILRKLRLDELPQLINIIKGDMSFIGPRPERQIFCQEYQHLVPDYRPGRRLNDPPDTQICIGLREKIPFYSFRFLVKPGLTGWAQVMHNYTSSIEETNEKLQYDLYYIKNMGLLLDILIIFKTIKIVLSGKGT